MWNWLINDSPSTYQTAIKHQTEEQLKKIRTYNSIIEDKLHQYIQHSNSV